MLADIVTVTCCESFPNEYIANNGLSTGCEKVYVYVAASLTRWIGPLGFLSGHNKSIYPNTADSVPSGVVPDEVELNEMLVFGKLPPLPPDQVIQFVNPLLQSLPLNVQVLSLTLFVSGCTPEITT